jgi:hypothetical protein
MTQAQTQRWCIAGAVAVAAALTWWSTWPNWKQGDQRLTRSAELASKVAGLDAAEAQLGATTERLAKARKSREYRCRVVPEVADVAGLMQELSLPVDGQRVRDQTFAVVDRPERETEHLELLPLRMDLEADFSSVWTVLDRIERLPRLVRVSGLDISLADDASKQNTRELLQASLSLDLVYAPVNLQETGQ